MSAGLITVYVSLYKLKHFQDPYFDSQSLPHILASLVKIH